LPIDNCIRNPPPRVAEFFFLDAPPRAVCKRLQGHSRQFAAARQGANDDRGEMRDSVGRSFSRTSALNRSFPRTRVSSFASSSLSGWHH
jgi:hypothetical protein